MQITRCLLALQLLAYVNTSDDTWEKKNQIISWDMVNTDN